ncbi:formate dehydrogenase accessory sulfurtransferase FdhD [Celerinatantimonas sp. YJH-8]|uniref:formate dehydrogenase accessory sulfurtransferase FdhD n=1 Tax=Celerinatantimonas sp. YJH-8 TaxID=3228714 RepID=UPI0038C73E82
MPARIDTSETEMLSSLARQRFSLESGITLETDYLAVEEPLQISLQWDEDSLQQQREWSLTMRTPGDDKALIKGLLLTQQVIEQLECIESIEPFDCQRRHEENHMLVSLKSGCIPKLEDNQRSYMSQSSCGICGLTSLRALSLQCEVHLDQATHWLEPALVLSYPEQLRQQQSLFKQTGAVHGAGYAVDGQIIAIAEDVGRHNAVDKLIGHIKTDGWHPQGVLVLSGRVSFELIQKAVIAGISTIVAVGAPSNLAVTMAKQFGVTLIGFTKVRQFNIYHGHWRLKSE